MNLRTLIVAAVLVAMVAVLAWSARDTDVTAPVAAPTAAPTPPDADGRPEAAWLRETSAATEIPRRTLAAYAAAAIRTQRDDPACRLPWNTLAGIGAVESSHGRFGGAQVGRDGVVSRPIIGIALDGNGVAAITDTDDGRLDGDNRWDRAVGPLQFIPATWDRWSVDADGDGRADPQDVDDAALTAARYLCHAGVDLGDDRGWSAAVLTYNRSTAYAEKVARTATGYADAL